MGFDEVLTSVVSAMPMMGGLVLCIVILKFDLDHERKARKEDCEAWDKEREQLETRLDQAHSKLVDVALNCHDESLKADVLSWKPIVTN